MDIDSLHRGVIGVLMGLTKTLSLAICNQRQRIDQSTATADAMLFKPQTATRVKRSLHTDTPFPPEEPAGQNPPDGAIINYYLRSPARSPIVLEITDAAGKLVRRFSSDDKPLAVDTPIRRPV